MEQKKKEEEEIIQCESQMLVLVLQICFASCMDAQLENIHSPVTPRLYLELEKKKILKCN